MPTVFSDLGITTFVATAGLLFGWLLRGVGAKRLTTCDEGADKDEVHRAREVLARLHDLAAQVAANVGQHSHRVEAINEELSAAEVYEPDVVLKAVTKLVRANNQMQQQLESAEGKLQEQARQIQSHATAALTDALTGLANRRAFDEEIARRYAEFQRHGRTFCVLMIDVDHFKKFNDTHGHQAGDEVLRGVARVLRQSAREMDVVARYGGEEFAVIFPGALVADVKASVERIRKAIQSARFHFEKVELRVTASLGIAHLLLDEDADTLIQRSDAALYASKESGRNCAHWHDGQAIHRITSQEEPAGKASPAAAPPSVAAGGERRAPKPKQVQAKADRPRPETVPHATPARTAGSEEPGGLQQPALCNRAEFCIVASRRLAEWHRGGPVPSIVLVQIDRLREIVSRHGHQVGNLALRATSQFLTAAIRDMDLVAHYDDMTFALLLPETGLANAVDVAERLRQAIGRCRLPIGNGDVQITVSVGGAEAAGKDELQKLLMRSEEALDAAGKSGGDCCYFHHGGQCESAAAVLGRLKVAH